jgi:hypothetical protein
LKVKIISVDCFSLVPENDADRAILKNHEKSTFKTPKYNAPKRLRAKSKKRGK